MVDIGRELFERLAAAQEQYMLHFSGQVRLTRDPDILAALLADTEAVAALARSRGDAAVEQAARQQAAAYRQEQQRLHQAHKEAGPSGRAVAQLAQRASLIMHRYGRHFAGKPRVSRDVGLLQEIAAQLQSLCPELAALHPEQGRSVEDFVALCHREAQAILAARQTGSAAQQAAHYAAAANTLMQTYVDCCVDRRRLAIRPALLQRLLDELQSCTDAMQALHDAGLTVPHHRESLDALQAQLEVWRGELAQLKPAGRPAPLGDRVEALTHELDELLQAYNELCDAAHAKGGDAALPAAAPLSSLCDRLGELSTQLETLAAGSAQAGVAAEAQVARDALAMFCQRYDQSAAAP